MHASPGERVQRRRKRRDQRFPFARLHLRDFAFVQDDAANELHVEVPHVEETAPRLARQCKGGNDHRLERLLHALLERGFRRICVFQLFLDLRLQLLVSRLEIGVAERLHFRFARVHGRDGRLYALDVALVFGADKSRDNSVEYLGCFHEWLCRPPKGVSALVLIPVRNDAAASIVHSNWLDAARQRNATRGMG